MARTKDAVLDGSVTKSQRSEQRVDGERGLGHGVFLVIGLGDPLVDEWRPVAQEQKLHDGIYAWSEGKSISAFIPKLDLHTQFVSIINFNAGEVLRPASR
jgi:hypothetical protein